MTADEPLPTYDFEIPLEIKNLEKKAEILQLWENAKNAFATNDVKKVRSDLLQVTKLDDSLYGVWYNLGIAKDFAGWCFNKAIELKPDHVDSWRGTVHYHELGIRMPYGDDNLDQHIHSDKLNSCFSMLQEIEIINKFKKFKITEFNEDQFNSFQMEMEFGDVHSSSTGTNMLNLSLCCLKYSMYDEAIKLLENTWYAETTLYLYFLGIAYRLSNNLKKSLEQFDKILNLEPENVYALFEKGIILSKSGDTLNGKKILEKANGIENNFDSFFKLCIDDNNDFPRDFGFEDDTKYLYNYNRAEPKIGLTWNQNYYDFKFY